MQEHELMISNETKLPTALVPLISGYLTCCICGVRLAIHQSKRGDPYCHPCVEFRRDRLERLKEATEKYDFLAKMLDPDTRLDLICAFLVPKERTTNTNRRRRRR